MDSMDSPWPKQKLWKAPPNVFFLFSNQNCLPSARGLQVSFENFVLPGFGKVTLGFHSGEVQKCHVEKCTVV